MLDQTASITPFAGLHVLISGGTTGIEVTLIEPGRTGTGFIDVSVEEQREKEALLEMLKAEDVAEAVCFCLPQSRRAVITSLQIEPFRHQ